MVTEILSYQKFRARSVPNIISEKHKTQQMDSALDYLSCYDAEGEEFAIEL